MIMPQISRLVSLCLLLLISQDDSLANDGEKSKLKQSARKNVTTETKHQPRKSNPPNIIFFLADDLGWNDVGFHSTGHSAIKTPFLDKMAELGVKLENYYVQPVCSPTRSQLMTGRYQIRMGIQHTNFSPGETLCLPLNETLLPEALRLRGYATHAVGKWHLGMAKKACLPTRRGFDSFLGIVLGTSNHYNYRRSLHLDRAKRIHADGNTLYENENATTKYRGVFSSELYANRAVKIIREHNKRKPLFLYLAFQMVHTPHKTPFRYIRNYKKKIKLEERRHYAARVAALEHAVKKVTKALVVNDLYKNSVIIFSTDNGGSLKNFACNWPLRGGKGRLWEGGMRAVGFVHSEHIPKRVRGSSYHGLMHVSDWLPTLVEGVAGGSLKRLKKPLDGYNMWKSIKLLRQSPRKVLLHNINPTKQAKEWRKRDTKQWGKLEKLPFNATIRAAIRVGKWKLMTGTAGSGERYLPAESKVKHKVFFYQDRAPIRLYNIKEDPSELNNLASKYPEKVLKMLRKLKHFHKQSVEPLTFKVDLNSNPSLHNGSWSPWLDVDY